MIPGYILTPINGSITRLNLYDTTKLTYSGKTPLVGAKAIKSGGFWGGIGAEVKESFSVTEMEKIQTTYSPMHAMGMDTKTSSMEPGLLMPGGNRSSAKMSRSMKHSSESSMWRRAYSSTKTLCPNRRTTSATAWTVE